MTNRSNENDSLEPGEKRRRRDEEWDRRMKRMREKQRSAEWHLASAEYWFAVARRERRRGIFR